MPTKLCKWGNSLGLRLPAYVVERTGARPGDYLYVRLTDSGDIVIRPVKERDIHPGYTPDDSPAAAKKTAPTAAGLLDEW